MALRHGNISARHKGRWTGKPVRIRRGPATVTGGAPRRARHGAATGPLSGPGRRGEVGPEARRPPSDHQAERPRGRGGSPMTKSVRAGLAGLLLALVLADPPPRPGRRPSASRAVDDAAAAHRRSRRPTGREPVDAAARRTLGRHALDSATAGDWDAPAVRSSTILGESHTFTPRLLGASGSSASAATRLQRRSATRRWRAGEELLAAYGSPTPSRFAPQLFPTGSTGVPAVTAAGHAVHRHRPPDRLRDDVLQRRARATPCAPGATVTAGGRPRSATPTGRRRSPRPAPGRSASAPRVTAPRRPRPSRPASPTARTGRAVASGRRRRAVRDLRRRRAVRHADTTAAATAIAGITEGQRYKKRARRRARSRPRSPPTPAALRAVKLGAQPRRARALLGPAAASRSASAARRAGTTRTSSVGDRRRTFLPAAERARPGPLRVRRRRHRRRVQPRQAGPRPQPRGVHGEVRAALVSPRRLLACAAAAPRRPRRRGVDLLVVGKAGVLRPAKAVTLQARDGEGRRAPLPRRRRRRRWRRSRAAAGWR